ncbi:peptidyl-tRNA hydrolase, partial [Streptomyces albidoflavus]
MTSEPLSDSPFRDERTARDEAPQFVLPLVVRLVRAEPPARTDARQTAARGGRTRLRVPRAGGG